MSTYFTDWNPLENETYLAHYGVPGMKWGVRKQYIRESKKLAKYKRNANVGYQMRRADRYGRKAKKQLVKGALTGAAAAGSYLGMNKWFGGLGPHKQATLLMDPIATGKNVIGSAGLVGVGATSAYHLTKAAVYGIKAASARRKVSTVGHNKAEQKVKRQTDKMVTMFANTPYEDAVNALKRNS